MPEAFCGIEMVRNNALLDLWVLWEKKLPKNCVSRPIGVTSHTTPLPAGEGLGEGPPPHGLETVRQKALFALCALWEKNLSTHTPTMFFFSQNNTDEQNTQRPTETLSQPITQNLTPTFSYNVLWYLYAGGVLWVRNSAQKGSVKSVSSVREKTPQRVLYMFFFSQKNTEEENTQHSTETLSQPISKSVIANLSWKASVNSVCRRRSVGSKLFAIMLCSLCVLCERKTYPHTPTMFFFSQNNTEEQNTQRPTETLSQPISQSVTANLSWKASVNSVCRRPSVGSKRAPKAPWTLCALWEKKLPSNSQASFLTWRVRSISHRRTQMNRTHSIPQRH